MPEYRTPLPGILAAMLETAINRMLAMDAKTPQRLRRLDDRMLQLDLTGVGITLYFAFNGQHVEVGTRSSSEPDTVISGSPAALFTMAVPDDGGYWGTPESRVKISGDATLARDLERLFSQLDPDWEGSLSRVLGDVWGHQVAAGLRSGAGQARKTASDAGEMLGEFLNSENSPIARAEELQAFGEGVEQVTEAIDRLERRIRKLEKTTGDAS